MNFQQELSITSLSFPLSPITSLSSKLETNSQCERKICAQRCVWKMPHREGKFVSLTKRNNLQIISRIFHDYRYLGKSTRKRKEKGCCAEKKLQSYKNFHLENLLKKDFPAKFLDSCAPEMNPSQENLNFPFK